MKKSTLLILILASTYANAQTGDHFLLSLQDALDIGLKNRYDIRAEAYTVSLAENTIAKKKKEWIPTISGTGDIHYNAQLQATYIPAGFIGLTKPELLALGAKNTTVFGLELDQTIYRPGITTDIKIAQNDLAWQKEKNRQTAIDIKLRIAEAYLDVLLKELQYTIAANDESRFRDYTELARGKYDHGALIENDYLHTKLDYENAKVQTEMAQQNYALATDKLKYQMNVPPQTILTLTDTLDVPPGRAGLPSDHSIPGSGVPPDQHGISSDSSIFGSGIPLTQPTPPPESKPSDRTEIRQLLLQQQSDRLELQKARQSILPSLSLVGNYSQQFLYDNFSYNQGEWWSPFSYVGLQLRIPFTAGFKNKNDRREFEIKAIETDLELSQKTADIDYEVRKATAELHNARSNMRITRTNYELSGNIYQTQKQQYQLGSFPYGSLLDTERSLSTAEQNYIRAVYDFLVARVNYQQAIGGF
jgi:outer membrane protein